MNRISSRIGNAISAVTCPGCGKHVVPTLPPATESSAPSAGTPGKRWSFIWVPPSGEVCPECSFPLARYAKRVKWIRLLRIGVIVLTVSILVYVATWFGDTPGWANWVLGIAALAGATALIVGIVGLVVGGRRSQP